jgi:hypothetical protein
MERAMSNGSYLESQITQLQTEIENLKRNRRLMGIMYPVGIGSLLLSLPISCCFCGATQSTIAGFLCLAALLLIPVAYMIIVAVQTGNPVVVLTGMGSLALLQDEINKKTQQLEALQAQCGPQPPIA